MPSLRGEGSSQMAGIEKAACSGDFRKTQQIGNGKVALACSGQFRLPLLGGSAIRAGISVDQPEQNLGLFISADVNLFICSSSFRI